MYERSGLRPRTFLLMLAGLFAIYHVSLPLAPGTFLVGLAMTFVAWRTGSVWPSVAIHFGANATAALIFLATRFGKPVPDVRPSFVVASAVIATGAACACLWRIAAAHPSTQQPVVATCRPSGWWPAYAAGLIPVALIAVGFVVSELPAGSLSRGRPSAEVRVIEAHWKGELPECPRPLFSIY